MLGKYNKLLQVVEEWKKKSDDLSAELDAAQREARNLSTDLIKMKTSHEELLETVEGLRRENKGLCNEIKDLSDQLGEGGRSAHETQKIIRRLEVEKEELQHGLDEAEGHNLKISLLPSEICRCRKKMSMLYGLEDCYYQKTEIHKNSYRTVV